MGDAKADEGRRRRLRFPPVLLPLLMTVVMVLVAVFVLDDDPAIRVDSQDGRSPAKERAEREEPEAREEPEEAIEREERSLTMVGDIGSSETSRSTLSGMASAGPTFHVALGDLSYAGPGSEPAWCALVRGTLGDTPVQIVAGNHEDDTGEDGRIANFEKCLPDQMNSQGRYGREYYFDVDKLARVILISPDLTIEGAHYYYGEGSVNQRWLEATIEGARGAGIPWVIVGMHKNCISVGQYFCNIYQDLFSLLIERKVDLVVSGHDHTYQRSGQLRAGTPECPTVLLDNFIPSCQADDGRDGRYRHGQGPVFVVSGAGGGELYDLNEADPERGYFAAVMGRNVAPRNGFLHIRMDRNRLEGSFVGTTPGSFTDRFTIADDE